MEFIHSHNIYYDYIYSRPKNCTLDDWQYKLTKIRHFGVLNNFMICLKDSMMTS